MQEELPFGLQIFNERNFTITSTTKSTGHAKTGSAEPRSPVPTPADRGPIASARLATCEDWHEDLEAALESTRRRLQQLGPIGRVRNERTPERP